MSDEGFGEAPFGELEFGGFEDAAVTAALTGTIAPSTPEAEIVTGGKTIILTLTGDTLIT